MTSHTVTSFFSSTYPTLFTLYSIPIFTAKNCKNGTLHNTRLSCPSIFPLFLCGCVAPVILIFVLESFKRTIYVCSDERIRLVSTSICTVSFLARVGLLRISESNLISYSRDFPFLTYSLQSFGTRHFLRSCKIKPRYDPISLFFLVQNLSMSSRVSVLCL